MYYFFCRHLLEFQNLSYKDGMYLKFQVSLWASHFFGVREPFLCSVSNQINFWSVCIFPWPFPMALYPRQNSSFIPAKIQVLVCNIDALNWWSFYNSIFNFCNSTFHIHNSTFFVYVRYSCLSIQCWYLPSFPKMRHRCSIFNIQVYSFTFRITFTLKGQCDMLTSQSNILVSTLNFTLGWADLGMVHRCT